MIFTSVAFSFLIYIYNQRVMLGFSFYKYLFGSMSYVLAQIDTCIQFGEDADVKVKEFDQEDD